MQAYLCIALDNGKKLDWPRLLPKHQQALRWYLEPLCHITCVLDRCRDGNVANSRDWQLQRNRQPHVLFSDFSYT